MSLKHTVLKRNALLPSPACLVSQVLFYAVRRLRLSTQVPQHTYSLFACNERIPWACTTRSSQRPAVTNPLSDSLGGNTSPPEVWNPKLLLAGIAGVVLFAIGLLQVHSKQSKHESENPSLFKSVLLFCYSCFLKPHSTGTKGTQEDALESFYSSQAEIYDVTRKTLLKGREDMLALVAAQLRFKAEKRSANRRIWVDVRPYSSRNSVCKPADIYMYTGRWGHGLDHRGHGEIS